MPMLRLALAQLNTTVGDLSGNRRLIEEAIRRAAAWRADVVAVPELEQPATEDEAPKKGGATKGKKASQKI